MKYLGLAEVMWLHDRLIATSGGTKQRIAADGLRAAAEPEYVGQTGLFESRMTRTLPMYGLALLGLALTTGPACSEHRGAVPVGTTLRGSSPLGSCSYTAPPSVATIDPATGSALLVGPGVLVSTCSGARVEWDVLAPTELRIFDGWRESGVPPRIRLQATLFAGAQELSDVACEDFHWTLGTDCSGIAELLRSSDGHWGYCATGAVILERAPGTCTVEATALGQRATRTLRLQ